MALTSRAIRNTPCSDAPRATASTVPNSTGGQVIHGDGLRAAAYRKYGDQVNAIVNTTVWFVADDDYAAMRSL